METDHYYMRSVFEAAKIGIVTLNVRGEIMDVNDPALETLNEDYIDIMGKISGMPFIVSTASKMAVVNRITASFVLSAITLSRLFWMTRLR